MGIQFQTVGNHRSLRCRSCSSGLSEVGALQDLVHYPAHRWARDRDRDVRDLSPNDKRRQCRMDKNLLSGDPRPARLLLLLRLPPVCSNPSLALGSLGLVCCAHSLLRSVHSEVDYVSVACFRLNQWPMGNGAMASITMAGVATRFSLRGTAQRLLALIRG